MWADILHDGVQLRGVDEQDESPEISLPEDEQDLIDRSEGDSGQELSEQEKNLAITQAKLIGDL